MDGLERFERLWEQFMDLDEKTAGDAPVASRHTDGGFSLLRGSHKGGGQSRALCSPDSREGRSAVFRPGPSARKPVEDLHEWRREVIGRFLVLWPVHGFYL